MVERPEAIGLLGKTLLFGTLGPADLARVAAELHERGFASGQLVFARGDPGEEIYLVVEGRVRLSVLAADGGELAFGHAGRGDIFGEIAVFDGGVRTADATALTKVRALGLPRASFRRLITTHLEIADTAIRFLCNRLRVTSGQLEGVALNRLEVRLAKYLIHKITTLNPARQNGRVTLDLGISQGELAMLIGTKRQSVNAALATLHSTGVLIRDGARLDCNVERLMQLAALE